MKVNGKTKVQMALGNFIKLMEQKSKVSGKMIYNKEKGKRFGKMGLFMKENIKKV